MEPQTISERSKISLFLVIAAVPILLAWGSDHQVISGLSKDRDEMRADVKEIKAVVNDIRVQMAATERRRREAVDAETRHGR